MNDVAGPPMPSPTASVGDALKPGQTIYEYRIDKVLGGGGFGITYLAQDSNLQLPVAIKEYFPLGSAIRTQEGFVKVRSSDGQGQFDWGLERFMDEARALASFRHPNIVRVLRYFKEYGTAYIVMEYESGDSLKYWLARQQEVSQGALLNLVYPLLDGLEAVHKLNFLHRDIKPDNIYIRADGSPVLLDFGAARRVTTSHDLTNIVTPGFAPFEQYHSQGNQGPWTDIYSLGAVLYWITTGHKPLEAAARVLNDGMEPASQRGNHRLYELELLKIIDKMLCPGEAQRPQNVAELRHEFRQIDDDRTKLMPDTGEQPTERAPQPRGASAGLVHEEADRRQNTTATILFLEVAEFAKYQPNHQAILKKHLNELVCKAIDGTEDSNRFFHETGQGVVVCFVGDPDEAMRSSLLLRSLLAQRFGQKVTAHMGLHMGPVRLRRDVDKHQILQGEGAQMAQHIMECAGANQIAVSQDLHTLLSRISDKSSWTFEPLGNRTDKHGRAHNVFALVDPITGKSGANQQHMTAPARSNVAGDRFTAQEVQLIETDLSRAIGPFAHVLVKKAMPLAGSAKELRDMLALAIQDPSVRASFLAGSAVNLKAIHSAPARPAEIGASHSLVNSISGSLRQAFQRRPTVAPSGDLIRSTPESTSLRTSSYLTPEQIVKLERCLSQQIGPLAKTILRKELASKANQVDLLQALARHIDRPDEKEKFLEFAKNI